MVKARKFATVKKIINPNDPRKKPFKPLPLTTNQPLNIIHRQPSHLFFLANDSLGPPYRILLDTNFINFSIQNKLDLFKNSMDCLLGKVIPCIPDCVIAQLEKFGKKYRLALRIAKDPRITRLKCTHRGTYADDCIVNRVSESRCFIVATCDKDLKRRLRKIPGVPIMYISSHQYTIERMPEALGAPRS